MPALRSIRSLIRQPGEQRQLLLEATVALMVARLLLALVPFRYLVEVTTCRLGVARFVESDRRRIRENIARSVSRAAAHLPGKTVCFPRAIAAQFMCRRRGIDATMIYGATTIEGKGLTAHVWVQDGTEDVIGCEELSRFRVLARYPAC